MLTYVLGEKNKYLSLYNNIKRDILSGRLKSGEKLPSKRALARDLSVSVITVQTAYEQLLSEGFIYSDERRGYFVDEVNVQPPEQRQLPAMPDEQKPEGVDLSGGATPFPFSVWAKLMRKVLSDCGEKLLLRVPCDGDAELKKAVASYLYRARGIVADPRQIVIGAGAEYLYGVIVQLLGRDKLFAVENPGYRAISSCYNLNGANCTYVSVGENGIDCDGVENSGAHAVHLSPSHQFPTGAVTPLFSRSRLISWARSGGRYIIEDDYDSEFRLTGKPLECMYSLCPDRVIYLNTFSKTLAPSMRMGYMILPPALYERYIKLFSSSACAVPVFEQKTLAAMLDGGHFERHLNRLKNHYRAVRKALHEKLLSLDNPPEISDTGSGLHLLARFKTAPSDEYIKKAAAASGVNIKCLSDYALAPATGLERYAVISFSGLTAERIAKFNIKTEPQ